MARPRRYASEAEKQAAYRLRKKGLVLVENVHRIEMESQGVHARDVLDVVREEVMLFEQRCDLCNRGWSASKPIICPYCGGRKRTV